jgi:CRP-like cAMP-binding protein
MRHLYPLSEDEERVLQDAFSGSLEIERERDIIRDGDRPTQCSLLMEGFVYRYKILADGKRQIIAFHFPGEIFDTQSFLLDTMDHSVAALTPATIGVIPHTVMREITEKFPRITRALWKETLVEAAIFRQWLVSAGRRSAHERLAHLICETYVRSRVIGMGSKLSIPWPFRQAELGDALGLTHIHINRTLQALRTAGLFRLAGGVLDILDWDRLADAGQFDPCYLQLEDVQIP